MFEAAKNAGQNKLRIANDATRRSRVFIEHKKENLFYCVIIFVRVISVYIYIYLRHISGLFLICGPHLGFWGFLGVSKGTNTVHD